METVNLLVDNSTCTAKGLTVSQFKQLKKLLSYSINPQAAYFSGAFNSTRSLITPRGEFPTGLLYIVYEYLRTSGVKFTRRDIRVAPNPLRVELRLKLEYPAYPEQIEAALAAKHCRRGIIVAPTGLGKSAIAALVIEQLQVPTLIVVPTLELKRQLTASMEAAFGKTPSIRVENVDSLDPNHVETEVGCIIIDEFHHSGAATYRKLNKKAWKNIYYRIGLTATPFRSQDHERLLLESVLSKVIYQIPYSLAVAKKYIVPLEAYYVDLPVKKNVEGHTWAQVYKELVTHNKERNSIVASLLSRLEQAGVSTLCLVKEISHGEDISKRTGIAFANGEEDKTRQYILEFNLNLRKGLIGTTGVLGEGVDTKLGEWAIIAGLGKSKPAFMQQVGRVFRIWQGKESCKIIIFRDTSHKWTKAHYQAQVKILKEEYGVAPVKLTSLE